MTTLTSLDVQDLSVRDAVEHRCVALRLSAYDARECVNVALLLLRLDASPAMAIAKAARLAMALAPSLPDV